MRTCIAATLITIAALQGMAPAHARAQQAQPRASPTPEAIALLIADPMFRGGVPEFFAGRLPDQLPASLSTAGRLVGSIAWGRQSRSALVLAMSPGEANRRVETHLLDAGWTLRAAMAGTLEARGFRPARTADPNLGVCSPDEAHIIAETRRWTGDSTAIVIRYSPGPHPACQTQQRSVERPDFPNLLPTLRLPPGLLPIGGSSGSSGMDDQSARTSLSGVVDIPHLLEHFAEQWREQGWTSAGTLTTGNVSLQLWEKSADDGGTLVGMLTIMRDGDDGVALDARAIRRR